ncbi:MAG: hypothetical protein ACOY40_03745 [Bacillota bacterium]
MRKYIPVLFLALAVVMGQAPPGWCGEDVTLRARPGLAGVFKVSQPVLIRVDIDNRGDAVKGQLVVAPPEPERPSVRQRPVYMSEVEVPAGGKAACDLVAPGGLAGGSYLVRLVAGERVLAETKLEGAAVAGGIVVLPLGEKVLGSSLFTWLDKTYGGQVTVKYLPPEELPEKPLFLCAADVIVADREAASRINPKQAGALKDWVRLGGKLILSGGAGAAPRGTFSDIAPSAEIKAGETGPFSRRDLGRGEVILSGTPLESINDRQGKAWESLELLSGEGDMARDKYSEIKYMLSDSGSYFPMVKMPGIPVLVLLWVLYVLVAGPGLYLALKRFNRRDLAWALVPAVALLTALGFYTLSPVNRLQAYLAHTVATVEIVDKDLAEVRASGAFVLPRGGDLEVTGRGQMLLEPLNYYSGRRDLRVSAFNDGDQSRIVYSNVEYGSMRQVHSYGMLPGVGRIGGNIFFRENRIMGEITNNTPFNLRDCRLVAGQSLFELGGIPAGGNRKINEPLYSAVIISPGEVPYNINPRSPAKVQESRIASEITAREESAGEVYFLGWSDGPVDQFRVARPPGQGQVSGLTLVRQRMDIEFPGGGFRLPAGFIRQTVAGLGGEYSVRREGLFIHRGALKITYDLPKTLNRDDFRLAAIEVPAVPPHATYTVEIYRYDTAQWEPVNRNGQNFTGQDAMKYISGRGKIELKITSQVESAEAVFQGIAVEGVIGQ